MKFVLFCNKIRQISTCSTLFEVSQRPISSLNCVKLFGNDINDYTNCHSERQRRIFIVKMLHFVQHDSEWMISEVQTDISLPIILRG